MRTELLKLDPDAEADDIETAGLLARQLRYPVAAANAGRIVGHSSLEVLSTYEIQPGDIRQLQEEGHSVYPIGWGIAVE